VRIDAHQHFWRYSAEEYGWIDAAMSVIRRDFLPADFATILAAEKLDGSVAVQARQSVAETDWLLALASANSSIKAVVGWLPLAELGQGATALLEQYRAHPRFKGVRHVLQAEPDAYFEHGGFNAALREVAACDLTYDLLIFARQLPAALAWVDRHPALRLVVDHIAKPVVEGAPPAAWRAQITELARRPNVFCKFSGVVTEVPGWSWTPQLLRPYFEVVLQAFGPERLMFGSDWPVCLVAAEYTRWLAFVKDSLAPLTPAEQSAIMGGTATKFYKLKS